MKYLSQINRVGFGCFYGFCEMKVVILGDCALVNADNALVLQH